MGELAAACGRGQHSGILYRCQVPSPRQEIRMQMGVSSKRHRQPTPLHDFGHCSQIDTGIHRQSPPAAELHQIGRVTQTLIDQRNDLNA